MNEVSVAQLQAAALTGKYMTEALLRGRARRGDLETVRIGTAVYVTRAALEAFLKREGVQERGR